jgi:hypothetical protein
LLRTNARQTAKSERGQGIHVFCVERNCAIEEGFCHYVCPNVQECPLWRSDHELVRSMTKPIYYDQRPRRLLPNVEDRKPPRPSAKHQTGNYIPNRLLLNSTSTMHQVRDLQNVPWIGHADGYKWPECECPACCSELLINLMQDTHKSHRQKPQNPSPAPDART